MNNHSHEVVESDAAMHGSAASDEDSIIKVAEIAMMIGMTVRWAGCNRFDCGSPSGDAWA